MSTFGGPRLPRILLDRVNGDSNRRRLQPDAGQTRKDLQREGRSSRKSFKTRQTPEAKRKPSVKSKTNPKSSHLFPQTSDVKVQKGGPEARGDSDDDIDGISDNSGFQSSEQDSQETRSHQQESDHKLAKDDADIAALEKKLGIKKGKKLPNSFNVEGLDDLIESLGEESPFMGGDAKRKREHDEDWLRKKRQRFVTRNENEKEEGEAAVLGEVLCNEGEEPEQEDDDTLSDTYRHTNLPRSKELKLRENPYVPPIKPSVDGDANPRPVSRRQPSPVDTELNRQIRRQLQGLLNRLSDSNILSIVNSVEDIYQNNPRQFVTSSMIDLILVAICDSTALNDTFIILHAGFVAALYKVIGSDFGAQLIERVVAGIEEHYEMQTEEKGGKQVKNLISLLAQLYNLHVISSVLLFDYIRTFLDTVSETNTELLLRIILSSGLQLRQDDPSALKDIVHVLNKRIAEAGLSSVSIRTRFMVETMSDLKDNRLKHGNGSSTIASQHISRMRKTLGSLNTRNLKATEPLRFELEDIRKSDKAGKWWLASAAVRDNRRVKPVNAGEDTQSLEQAPRKPDDAGETNLETLDLQQLAHEQSMNTDIRRAIFVSVMSASDCKDAHQRLLKLKLTRTQERQIPNVLLRCTGSERQYNPYYTIIARRLCGDHKLRKAFQFALWDLFKHLGEGAEGGEASEDDAEFRVHGSPLATSVLVNQAKTYASLVLGGNLSILVLKNLDLVHLQPKTRVFVEVMIVTIMTQHLKKAGSGGIRQLLPTFEDARASPRLTAGLQWFVRDVVAVSDLVEHKRERKVIKTFCEGLCTRLASSLADPRC